MEQEAFGGSGHSLGRCGARPTSTPAVPTKVAMSRCRSSHTAPSATERLRDSGPCGTTFERCGVVATSRMRIATETRHQELGDVAWQGERDRLDSNRGGRCGAFGRGRAAVETAPGTARPDQGGPGDLSGATHRTDVPHFS